MGFHISWLAVRGKPPEAVRSELALIETEDRGPVPESEVDAVLLSSGWYLVHFNDPQPHELSNSSLERLSVLADVVTCVAEEAAMVSMASYFSNGVKKWAVVHDSDLGAEHLETEGELPEQFGAIRDRLLAQLAADPQPCDYIFEVPTELAQSITGFKHDQFRDDEESNPFTVLARKIPASTPTRAQIPSARPVKAIQKPWWQFW
ncbi:hypothetical protein CLU86_0599 [Acidovorax sp. 62]|uniref:hypothetical protein n=1 Tax=Acidovorax sp. 62 TaxID=2035203 RepID=UPI000C687218|nr:hypothetical protein [Acidovorax sp. 62]PIF89722.1 hypothetical protein CLU86_0599 [Acidovorax sp. 62]